MAGSGAPRGDRARWVSVLLSLVCVALVTFCLTGAALADGVRLYNQDASSYDLYVKHSGSAVHTSIGPRTVSNICSAACTITVKSTGATLQAQGGETILIKNGRLVRR